MRQAGTGRTCRNMPISLLRYPPHRHATTFYIKYNQQPSSLIATSEKKTSNLPGAPRQKKGDPLELDETGFYVHRPRFIHTNLQKLSSSAHKTAAKYCCTVSCRATPWSQVATFYSFGAEPAFLLLTAYPTLPGSKCTAWERWPGPSIWRGGRCTARRSRKPSSRPRCSATLLACAFVSERVTLHGRGPRRNTSCLLYTSPSPRD